MKKFTLLFLPLLFMCNSNVSTSKRIAFTSIITHQYFAQQIAGDRFTVYSMAGQGQNEHSYTPTPSQIANLSKSVIFFRTGVEFEEGVIPKALKMVPTIRVVDLRKNINLIEMEDNCDHDHESNHSTSNHGTNKDPHIWLSPKLMKTQLFTIKESFTLVDPEGKAVYEKNYSRLINKLDSLDNFIRTALAPLSGSILFVFHPAFGYLAAEYGLIQKAIEVSGKEPSAAQISQLIDLGNKDKFNVLFVQPQYSPKNSEAIAKQIGCIVIPINHLPEDYFYEMGNMATVISRSLKAK